jgi:CBS domain containing-hemolysin-like protein
VLLSRIDAGDSYLSGVLPAVTVFGLGLTLVVAPVTATVMAAADERHSGIASGINTAVSRLAGLIVVAALPVVAGLTGKRFYDPAAMDHGFHVAMLTCAALAAAGGVLAWLTIDSDVLAAEPLAGGDLPTGALHDFSCAVAGPSLRPGREAQCQPIAAHSAAG